MILPTRLPDEALEILRIFIRSETRQAGSSLSLESIRQVRKLSESGVDTGLSSLVDAELIELKGEEGCRRAVLTGVGEAFFGRYHFSCR